MRAVKALALLAAVALLGAAPDPKADGAYFTGTWKCGQDVVWTFAPLVDGGDWIRITYGDPQHPEGIAAMGFVTGLKAWVYRDFHTDGSYADLTSPAPADGRWIWSGPYYPAGAGQPLAGRITYTEVTATRYDRTFEMLKDGTYHAMGGDSCLKT